MRSLTPNALLRRTADGPGALSDHVGSRPLRVLSSVEAAVLESFVHHADVAEARAAALHALDGEVADESRVVRARAALDGGVVLVSARGLRVLPDGLDA